MFSYFTILLQANLSPVYISTNLEKRDFLVLELVFSELLQSCYGSWLFNIPSSHPCSTKKSFHQHPIGEGRLKE
jgi:hypothetical protein